MTDSEQITGEQLQKPGIGFFARMVIRKVATLNRPGYTAGIDWSGVMVRQVELKFQIIAECTADVGMHRNIIKAVIQR